MTFGFLETSDIFGRLMVCTKTVSLLICLIFIVKWIAGKRLPPWWNYGLWLMLLCHMTVFPIYTFVSEIGNFVSVSINHDIISPLYTNKEFLMCGTAVVSPPSRLPGNISIHSIFLFFWFTGALVLGTGILVKNIRFCRSISGLPTLSDERILALFFACKKRMNVRKPVRVLVTDQSRSPSLIGYFRPTLLLPADIVEKLDDKELSFVFMHEFAHLKHHDIALSWFTVIFEVIYWFNPLVWLAFHHMRLDQEAVCDATVLSNTTPYQPFEYAKMIVHFLADDGRNSHLNSIAYVLESRTQLEKRLALIVGKRKNTKKRTFMSVVLLVAMGAIISFLPGALEESIANSDWNKDARTYFENAQLSIQQKDYIAAETILETYVAARPRDIPKAMYLSLGEIYCCQGKIRDALDILTKGLERYPTEKELLENIMSCRGRLLFQEQRFVEAGKAYETLFDEYPKERYQLVNAADCYILAGEIGEARRVFTRMTNLLEDMTDVMWLEVLIETSRRLGLADKTETYIRCLQEADIDSVLLPSLMVKAAALPHENGGEHEKIYGLPDIETFPVAVKQIKPRYPDEAAKKKISGKVMLRFIITKEGTVKNSSVIESSPKLIFDASALAAIDQYRFKPGMKNGETVDVMVTAPMAFNIINPPVEKKPILLLAQPL
jgi:bla regulator protein BlaR1